MLLRQFSPKDHVQNQLLILAAVFLVLYSLVLTFSPAVRLHSWTVPLRWGHWLGVVLWLIVFFWLDYHTRLRLPERDPYLLPVAALLSGWGMLTIWRLDSTFGWRQAAWLVVSGLVFWSGMRLPDLLSLLRRYKYLWLTGGLLLAALTFVVGTYPGGVGPNLWLGCCGIYLQPSEPLKLLMLIYLSAYLADRLPLSFGTMQFLLPTTILVGAALGILLAQRDLGTASLFILLYFFVIYLASGRWQVLLVGAFFILAAGSIGYLRFDVIRLRVNTWLDPWSDPSGSSYQVVQSLIALGTGGVFGSGPGLGSPGVVPIAHSDFIFAAISEELGLTGSLALLLLLSLLVVRGLLAAVRSSSNYRRYLAAGLSVYFALQSLLIIAGNVRLLPLTGVTLPFVSYGGSSLLTSFVSLLILMQISSQPEGEPAVLLTPKPYLQLSTALLTGFLLTGFVCGWWGVVRGPELSGRFDNPRPYIIDRYSPRGEILDRQNLPIMTTIGSPGKYSRRLLYPPLGPLIGYSHPLYGQAGLEKSLDVYLRGIQGRPTSEIWIHQLLFAQRPAGLDVRLSLDLELQQRADDLLDGKSGALVLLNARTGEVLVMASHPYFDPNQIDSQWDVWLRDERSPLINRATQGVYPPGTALGPFLVAQLEGRGLLPPLPKEPEILFNGLRWQCTAPITSQAGWGEMISHGCPGALIAMGDLLGPSQLMQLFERLGFTRTPDLPLASASLARFAEVKDPLQEALGQGHVMVTPLQMALATAALTGMGNQPAPLLLVSVHTPTQGWIVMPTGPSAACFPARSAVRVVEMLALPDLPFWQTVGLAQTRQGPVTWYLGGTLPDWRGVPLAIALLLEEDNPALAEQIGLEMLKETLGW